MIKTEKDFLKVSNECTESLNQKFDGSNGKRSIVICGGTGCLSSDSALILAEFEKQIKERGLEDKVTVNKVGCFGFCSQGPFVKIFPEDTLYRTVKVSDVKETLLNRPDNLEIVLTGRNAHPKIIEIAHLVSEIKPVKHYWDTGIAARKGIEY